MPPAHPQDTKSENRSETIIVLLMGGGQPDRACSAHLIPAARSLTKLPRLRHSKSVSGSTYRATASMCRLSLPLTRPASIFE